MRPKSSSLTLMSRRAGARMVPSSTGISYVLPVRLSVTVRVSRRSWPAPSPATPACSWVSLLTGAPQIFGSPQSSHVGPAYPAVITAVDVAPTTSTRVRRITPTRPPLPPGNAVLEIPMAETITAPAAATRPRCRRRCGIPLPWPSRRPAGAARSCADLTFVAALGGFHLAVVVRAELGVPVRPLGRGVERHEAQLADREPRPELDRHA